MSSFHEDCENLFESHFEAFLANDVDGNLWKGYYHKKIEEYRKKIAKVTAEINPFVKPCADPRRGVERKIGGRRLQLRNLVEAVPRFSR